jgi:pyrroline-5-carboxylate reductase
MTKIAFIGGGNMASCIIGGMLANGFSAQQIRVSDPGEQARANVQETYGIAASSDNHAAVDGADIVILAVKPQVMGPVVSDLAPSLNPTSAVVSIAAGIQIADLQNWLGDKQAIVRAMPNTPAMVQTGATGLFANALINSQQKEAIQAIFNAVGIACWVDSEALIDAVTAVSGSGPAYFFLVMEVMQKVARELGLAEQTAEQLTIQTALGAAKMASTGNLNTSQLRQQVTSPGGTTHAAIETFRAGGIEESFRQAMQAALNRAEEMSKEFSS